MTMLNFTSPEPPISKKASGRDVFFANDSKVYERLQGHERRGARAMAWVALPVAVVAIGAIVYATTPRRDSSMVVVPPIAANTATAPTPVMNTPAAQPNKDDQMFSATTAPPAVHQAAPARMAQVSPRPVAPRREPVSRSASAGAPVIVAAPAPVVTTPPAAMAPVPVTPAPVDTTPQPSATPPAADAPAAAQ